MRQITMLLVVIVCTVGIIGCAKKEDELNITAESEITMENLDLYMNRDDVQYVDLRNFNSRFLSGFIDGFESIPFFDYLDYRAFDREDAYEFQPDQLINERVIELLFDQEKAIFLYADGCIRSGYLKDVLNHLGYERVFVLGGFFEYQGDYLVVGDGDFTFGDMFYTEYVSSETGYMYIMSGKMNMGRKVTTIRFDIIDTEGNTLRSTDLNSEINFNNVLTSIEEYITSESLTINEVFTLYNEIKPNDYVPFPSEYNTEFLALIETLVIK